MKKTIYMMIAAGTILCTVSCEKETAFVFNEGEGMFDCEKLDVDYINSDQATRAGNVSTDNFIVRFINSNNETQKSYYYKDMPQIVSLPVGKYKVVADLGGNPVAGFDSVYYRGEIPEIEITANQITTPPSEAVTCKLSNIKIAVNIKEMASGITGNDNSILGNDVKVTVEVGDGGALEYKIGETKAGYFRYVEGSNTITATFTGTVDNNPVTEVRSFTNAAAGNFYTINFTVAKPDSDDPNSGTIGGGDGDITGITIDTDIESVDVTIPSGEVDDPYENVIEDGRRGNN